MTTVTVTVVVLINIFLSYLGLFLNNITITSTSTPMIYGYDLLTAAIIIVTPLDFHLLQISVYIRLKKIRTCVRINDHPL